MVRHRTDRTGTDTTVTDVGTGPAPALQPPSLLRAGDV